LLPALQHHEQSLRLVQRHDTRAPEPAARCTILEGERDGRHGELVERGEALSALLTLLPPEGDQSSLATRGEAPLAHRCLEPLAERHESLLMRRQLRAHVLVVIDPRPLREGNRWAACKATWRPVALAALGMEPLGLQIGWRLGALPAEIEQQRTLARDESFEFIRLHA
jgi:hypothetical protein